VWDTWSGVWGGDVVVSRNFEKCSGRFGGVVWGGHLSRETLVVMWGAFAEGLSCVYCEL